MALVYIAGPYTAKSRWDVTCNVNAAKRVALEVGTLGLFPVTPHVLGSGFEDCQTEEFWYRGTLELLRRCDAVILVPGWENSKGATEERRAALELGLPVFERVADLEGLVAS